MLLRLLTPFFWFCTFLLLLLVSLSTPVIPQIFLLSASADISGTVLGVTAGSAQETVDFGVWGWCAGEATYTLLGETHDLVAAQCSARHLGYTLDPTVQEILQIENEEQNAQLVLTSITTALVLHPIACGLAWLAWMLSLFYSFRPQPGCFSLCLVLPAASTAGTITTVIFIVDVVFVAVVRSKVWDASNGDVSVSFGNAVWMVLGAMISAWIAMALTVAGVCCGERGWWRERRNGRAGKY